MRGCAEYIMYSSQYFVDATEYYEEGDDYDYYDDAEE
jgi:beta-galactosidase beta subunit